LYTVPPQKLKRPNRLRDSDGIMESGVAVTGPAKPTVDITNAFKMMKVVD
jgi:hypothetical protein